MPLPLEIRSADNTLDFIPEAIEWLTGCPPLMRGGRIVQRRQTPRAGWYVIRDGSACGPFPTDAAAQRYVNGRVGS